ncbi:DHHA1 domain-containing protein [Candidatus Nitrosocosmicus hydrocola]|uniref:DHHA1 domain-containing protein n=1 Tax=Candidatus Nitrosocosmicus hydrocola TaxID=1826872 RepID=UPI0011E5AD2F|nr:DHHA1 domain-containing protein [Candidatus Nitrosocosmicus hydrocola]
MKSICISHKEDVDGIVSAALLQKGLKIKNLFLVDYPNLLNSLDYVISICSKDKKFTRVFICDVGLNMKNQFLFLEKLKVLVSNNIEVIYIDHHYLEPVIKNKITEMGIKLVHDIGECTSVQIYYLLKNHISKVFSFFASAGALTDYMEDRPRARVLVNKFDRTFLMLEACYLSYIISASQKDIDFLKLISKQISRGKMPHELRNGCNLVKQFSGKVSNAISLIEKESVHLNNISYFEHDLDLSSSMIVNFVLGLSGKKVGIAFKMKTNINSYILSIRGSKDCKTHLGKLVNNLSMDFGGSGGGHDKACGAVIPMDNFPKFLQTLDESIR